MHTPNTMEEIDLNASSEESILSLKPIESLRSRTGDGEVIGAGYVT